MTVLVVGNATVDRTHRVPHLPRAGETLLAIATRTEPGGKGLNQAVTAARAGAAVRFVAGIGDDPDAALIRAFLEAEGLASGLVSGPGESDRSTILVDLAGENLIVSTAGQALALPAAVARAALGGLRAGDALLVQGNLDRTLTLELVRAARAAGIRTLANAAPLAWDWAPLLPLLDLLVVNEVEARALDPRAVPVVVRTLGERGAELTAEGRSRLVPAPRVAPVDTTGAGDVVCGMLAAGLDLGLDHETALRAAVTAAALKVQRPGTASGLPSAAALRGLLR